MHRNTFLLMSLLAIFAALIVGVNIGRQFPLSAPTQTQPSSTPTLRPALPAQTTTSATKPYRNTFCKVAFDYPGTLTLLESASGSAAFTSSSAKDGILLTCQKDIPRPAISQENSEDIRIGSVTAKLYHSQSASDGASIDTLIFRHPATKLDVFLAGTGEVFQNLLKTLAIL